MPVVPPPDLEHVLSAVAHRMTRETATLLASHGSSIEEWRVLSLLSTTNGQAMSEIASYSLLPAPSVTKLIDRMVAANLVHRRGDDRDRRRVLVHLAPRGRTLFAGLSALVLDRQAAVDATVREVVEPSLLAQLLSDVLARLN